MFTESKMFDWKNCAHLHFIHEMRILTKRDVQVSPLYMPGSDTFQGPKSGPDCRSAASSEADL